MSRYGWHYRFFIQKVVHMKFRLLLILLLAISPLCAALVTPTDQASYNAAIAQGSVVVDFYADWCGPCQGMHPIIGQLVGQFPQITFVKANLDALQSIAQSLGIMSIPAFVFYKNGTKVWQHSGAMKKGELAAAIKKYLS